MERYIHKPGCPSPMMCNCYPVGNLPMEYIEELSIALKWLSQHKRQCQPCIRRCLKELQNPQKQEMEDGHFVWYCSGCRQALDKELQQSFGDLVKNLPDEVYHIARCAFVAGTEGVSWLEMLPLLRKGLRLRDGKVTFSRQILEELYGRLNSLVPKET